LKTITKKGPPVIAKAIARPISFIHRTWPVAGLAAALVVNLAWVGVLGYGFFKIVEPVFF
jgi:hypothetical protein